MFERDTRRFHIVGYRIDLDRGNVYVNGEIQHLYFEGGTGYCGQFTVQFYKHVEHGNNL